jgi:hypothetical protein
VFALQDRIVDADTYAQIAAHPQRQSCVAVACALEGVVEACELAREAGDTRRAERYGEAIRVALDFLYEAQRLEHATSRERGGFGHSLAYRTQRIDVAGHVAHGLMGAIRLGLAS